MGNQQGKSNQQQSPKKMADNVNQQQPYSNNINSQNQLPNDSKNDLINSNRMSNRNSPKNQSRGPSAMDNYKNSNSRTNNRLGDQKSNNKNQGIERRGNFYNQGDDDNQFMPLLRLQSKGQINLRITLIQLTRSNIPKLHLKKTSAIYNSVLKWTKSNRNTFTFVLKQDNSYQLTMEVDLQGNSLNNTNQEWSALCPINIPFGQTVKVGQMTCVNWYCRLDQQQQQQQEEAQLGPSLKNIDFKISQQAFDKWGEKVPKNFYDQQKNQIVKKVYRNQQATKFVAYKELSRYFDKTNSWKASTFIQQTEKAFKGWIIQVSDHSSMVSISNELHSDLKNRQAFYTKTMFQSSNGSDSIFKLF